MRIYPPGGVERTPGGKDRDRGSDDAGGRVAFAFDREGAWAARRRMIGHKTRGGGSLPPRRARKHRGGRS